MSVLICVNTLPGTRRAFFFGTASHMPRDCRKSAALRSPLAAALSKAGRALPAGSTAAAAAGHVEGRGTLQNVAASLDCCDAAICRGQHASSGLLLACCASRQHARRMAI